MQIKNHNCTVENSQPKISSIASEIARHKAKLEAAKVQEKYLQQECKMERQKALLDRDLKVLRCKREIEEAQIEVNSLKFFDEVPGEDFAEKERPDIQITAEERV